ncbi:sulfatase-like hydrolase/transferase [Microbulbifer agarilyticus]|uniref:sulfatase-like hydrolase/transferase n=1 Tax=Microbulbifer agarilyticus TaxID=260552 RepID=UPI001C9374DD|nr:sulfatase-like hydrolase/transferase [Microbulbifer agarilyticus]MBY6212099.1 sulfatase-like hydrolase/transferase [Microbulbifer agarilyticus]
MMRATTLFLASIFLPLTTLADNVVHDAEYYVLKLQHGEKWKQEDQELDQKLRQLRQKYGRPPNIVYLLWDDTAFGAVGFPALQKNFGYTTPNINKMAAEGINFTRMYSEPSCTPTRAAFLTGRHPVRHGMGVVGMPHEFSGMREEEVTIAEVLSKNGYATAFFGKGHLGDIAESYLHNQGFDEALFTPMNQITSLYNPQANAVNAVLGFAPEIYPPDPYRLDNPGLIPEGWVMNIEGKKGEQGKEWCGTSNECFAKFDPEAERRTIDFIRRNAEAKKPFFVAYWPNFLNFLAVYNPKNSVAGLMVADAFPAVDDFVGQLMEELKTLGIAENTLFIAMADNGPMVHSPPTGWGMLPMLYRGGKGDFTEGGVRVPAFAWWPGMIEQGQTVGDIIHVTDLYTTFARLGGAKDNIPTDRVVDGLDQTALLLKGDTHSRRDYVFIYAGHELGATVKGRYKRHWIGAGDVAASGMPEAYFDLYMDPREENPQLTPLIHTQGQFNRMVARHELMKKKYPDMPNAKGIPYTGLSNARPETKAIAERVKQVTEELPFSVESYLEFYLPGSDKVGDWGH